MRQNKCRSDLPLDRLRIWLDFNECCAAAENGDPVYLFSQADLVNDSEGNEVVLQEGMEVSVFDHDLDEMRRPDAILAEGIVMRNTLAQYPQVKWLLRLKRNGAGIAGGDGYVYRLSELRECGEVPKKKL